MLTYHVHGLGQVTPKAADRIAEALAKKRIARVAFRGRTYEVLFGQIPKAPGKLWWEFVKAYRRLAIRGLRVRPQPVIPREIRIPTTEADAVVA